MQNKKLVLVEEIKERTQCPAGTHNAVCVAVYDLGVQRGLNGWPNRQKLALIFEIAEKITDGPLAGQPYRLSKIVTASLDDKATLTVLLTAWLGRNSLLRTNSKRQITLDELVGKPCMLTVAHTTSGEKTTATITAITSQMRGLPVVTSTFDPAQVPAWVLKIQEERLDKPQSPPKTSGTQHANDDVNTLLGIDDVNDKTGGK